MAPRSRFGALRNPGYRMLFLAESFLSVGFFAGQIARGWLAVELTGSNAGLGGVYLAAGIPFVAFGAFGGVIADRFPKRTVLVGAQSLVFVGALSVGLLDAFGLVAYWMLLGSAVIQSIGFATFSPARSALLSELVDRETLPNAVVLAQMNTSSSRIVGPAIAGALIGLPLVGTAGVFLIVSCLSLVAIAWTWCLPPAPPRGSMVPWAPVSELADGIRYVRSQPRVMLLIVVSTVIMVIGSPYLAFLPKLAEGTFHVGAAGYGFMSAVGAIGALSATFWIAGRVYRANIWRMQAAFATAFSVGLLSLAGAPSYWIALAANVVLGGAWAGFTAMNNTLILTETDLAYHGRIQSLLMVGYGAAGLLALPLGIAADAIGLRETLAGMGTICLVTMVLYSTVRSVSVSSQARR